MYLHPMLYHVAQIRPTSAAEVDGPPHVVSLADMLNPATYVEVCLIVGGVLGVLAVMVWGVVRCVQRLRRAEY